MENTKICSKCGRELPLSEFSKCKRSKDGLNYWCNECRKQYYQDNRKAILAQQNQYNAEHKELRTAYNKKWYAEHKELKDAYSKQWRADNADKIKQYNAERYATIESYAYRVRRNNLQADRKHGRCGKDEDPLAPLEYYICGIQQRDFYDGKQYHWSEMGFDRIDNSKPHTIDNIVPCSTANNRRRGKKTFEEFCEMMRKEKNELELVLN